MKNLQLPMKAMAVATAVAVRPAIEEHHEAKELQRMAERSDAFLSNRLRARQARTFLCPLKINGTVRFMPVDFSI